MHVDSTPRINQVQAHVFRTLYMVIHISASTLLQLYVLQQRPSCTHLSTLRCYRLALIELELASSGDPSTPTGAYRLPRPQKLPQRDSIPWDPLRVVPWRFRIPKPQNTPSLLKTPETSLLRIFLPPLSTTVRRLGPLEASQLGRKGGAWPYLTSKYSAALGTKHQHHQLAALYH